MQQATHTVTQWPWWRRTLSFGRVWAGPGGRQQDGGCMLTATTHKRTENNMHTAVLPLCLPQWDGRQRCRPRKACVSTPHLWLPESDTLSPLFSCYLDRWCIYVFTWCLYDIYTYFLGMWGLTFTVPRVALGSDTAGYRSLTRAATHPRRRPGREGGWKRGGPGSKWRKPGRKNHTTLTSVVGTGKVRCTV